MQKVCQRHPLHTALIAVFDFWIGNDDRPGNLKADLGDGGFGAIFAMDQGASLLCCAPRRQDAADDYRKFFVLDVRDSTQYLTDYIPGASNIQWRSVFVERAKPPRDKTIPVYRNSSPLAGQVAMALLVDAYENVRSFSWGHT